MNPAALESYLDNFYWYQLRAVARELNLSQKGNRKTLIARIAELHADPCCSTKVVRAARAVEQEAAGKGKKRRRVTKDDRAVRNLCQQFESAAVSDAAAQLEATDLSGTEDESTPPARAAVAPAMAPASLVGGTPGQPAGSLTSPRLMYVPRHLCPWQPSPASTAVAAC